MTPNDHSSYVLLQCTRGHLTVRYAPLYAPDLGHFDWRCTEAISTVRVPQANYECTDYCRADAQVVDDEAIHAAFRLGGRAALLDLEFQRDDLEDVS